MTKIPMIRNLINNDQKTKRTALNKLSLKITFKTYIYIEIDCSIKIAFITHSQHNVDATLKLIMKKTHAIFLDEKEEKKIFKTFVDDNSLII